MRAAIVGCGQIARIHVQALQTLPDVTISALVDRDIRRAQALQGRVNGTPALYSDLEDLLADSVPDVIHVLTPPSSHEQIAIRCMEAGAHTIVEKPMAVSRDQA